MLSHMTTRPSIPFLLGAATLLLSLSPAAALDSGIDDPPHSIVAPVRVFDAMRTPRTVEPVSHSLPFALRQMLADGDGPILVAPDMRSALMDFYAARNYAALWVDDSDLRPAGEALLATLQRLTGQALIDAKPMLAAIAERRPSAKFMARAETEALLSQAILTYAIDPENPLASGRLRKPLTAIASAANLTDSLYRWLPPDPSFWRLRAATSAYKNFAARGAWAVVPTGEKLAIGDSDPRVAIVKQRLIASGELSDSGAIVGLFDEALDRAVRTFQVRHGLTADGVVGRQTIAALNVPPERRLESLIVNLKRLHAQQRDWGATFIVVNVPAQSMRLVQDGVTTLAADVIVGRTDRPTPEVHGAIERIEFNPFWTVPTRIARLDLLPKIQVDSTYLSANSFKVYELGANGTKPVDPATVDWTNEAVRKRPYQFRQDPGAANALGAAKFLFPNEFDVYLHGTNNRMLFNKEARFLSSGCIRLPDELALAELVLRNDPNWTREKIDASVRKGRNVGVRLQTPLPVHVVYDTVWVDEAGIVHFRDDIYGRDQQPTEALAASAAMEG